MTSKRVIENAQDGYYYGHGRVAVRYGEESIIFKGDKYFAKTLNEVFEGFKERGL